MTALSPGETRQMRAAVGDELATALQPWDGARRIGRPADYVPGLYRVHQIIAHDLLSRRVGLTNWSATVVQIIAYQGGDLSRLQSHWLSRIEREVEGSLE